MPRVNPEILRWAREGAGLSPSEAARKLGLREARGVAGVDRILGMEEGKGEPSRPLLVKMAKQYRRPLLTFYLARPPAKGDRGQDFRTLPEDSLPEDEPLLDALIRDVVARQRMVRAALEDAEEADPLPFVGSTTAADGVQQVLSGIRETVGVTLEDFRAAQGPDEAFQLLRGHVEDAGVFVLLLGNLGTHHTNIEVETFRGFALADRVAPFVVINDQDARAAWSFTLLHELVHIWLGQTGVSGGTAERSIERFCNEVASEFLLPSRELRELDLPSPGDIENTAARIGAFAAARNVSHSMVAYKLYRADRITYGTWSELSAHFRERWQEEQESRRLRGRERSGGPDYFVVRRHRLGGALVEVTARLLASGALTTTKAGQVLGVKPKQVGTLIGEIGPLSRAS